MLEHILRNSTKWIRVLNVVNLKNPVPSQVILTGHSPHPHRLETTSQEDLIYLLIIYYFILFTVSVLECYPKLVMTFLIVGTLPIILEMQKQSKQSENSLSKITHLIGYKAKTRTQAG